MSLTTIPPLVKPDEFEFIQRLAKCLVISDYFKGFHPSDMEGAVAQAVVRILAGREMGVPPVSAVMNINWVEGKVSPSSQLMLACAKNAGYSYATRETGTVEEETAKVEIQWFIKGEETKRGPIGTSAFSWDDVKRASLLISKKGNAKENWQKYPWDMLFWRAVSRGVRRFCPDATSGIAVYTLDELGGEMNPETGGAIDIPNGGSAEAQAAVVERKLAELKGSGEDLKFPVGFEVTKEQADESEVFHEQVRDAAEDGRAKQESLLVDELDDGPFVTATDFSDDEWEIVKEWDKHQDRGAFPHASDPRWRLSGVIKDEVLEEAKRWQESQGKAKA